MKLIVGLGNPGRVYADTRHNIGFFVLSALAKAHKITLKSNIDSHSLSAKFKFKGQEVMFAEPLTFMNLSGLSVKQLLKKYKINLEDLLVICDDLDLELGRLKIKDSGSSGGHRGLGSIADSLASKNFSRMRIGIGRPAGKTDAAEYVLSPFTKKEKEAVSLIVETACNCANSWVEQGIEKTMNIFNQRSVIK